MINLKPINIEGHTFLTISVELPKPNLHVVSNDKTSLDLVISIHFVFNCNACITLILWG